MEAKVFEQDMTKAQAITKQAAVAVGIGVIYFIMCVINPLNLLVGASSLAAFANIRWANLLRGFVLFSPGAAFGIAAGAHAFNVYSGKAALLAYSAMPLIQLGISLVAYGISKAWGRSMAKDLTILAVYGLIVGLIATLHLQTFAVLFHGSTWGELASWAAQWKVLTHVAVFMLGYPVSRYFETTKIFSTK